MSLRKSSATCAASSRRRRRCRTPARTAVPRATRLRRRFPCRRRGRSRPTRDANPRPCSVSPPPTPGAVRKSSWRSWPGTKKDRRSRRTGNSWECTGCGACEEVCPVDIPFDTVWDDVKAWMVNSGYERKELQPYLANVRETHNLFGKPAEDRGAWIPPEAVQSANPEVLYWVGCVASYERQQIARAVVKILNAAKVPYRILGKDEWCSGAPLARMGYQETTKKELMPHNVNAVEETGAKVLVTACAECYRAFAPDYKQWGGNPPYSVFHISHYVEKLIREKRIAFTKPLPQKIAFHDACHMSRVSQVYEPPRQALKFIRDLKVLEILPHHEDALCSGAGGGFPAVFPEQAAGVGQRRPAAAEDTGAAGLAATIPHRQMHFEGLGRAPNMALDIGDLAA